MSEQKVTDLIAEYGCRNIEGIDYLDLFEAIEKVEGSAFVQSGRYCNELQFTHRSTGRTVTLSCAGMYFRPNKDYYKIGKDTSCKMVSKALGTGDGQYTPSCDDCLISCLRRRRADLELIPSKVTVANGFFYK